MYISMMAMISKVLENDEILEFTLSGVDRSVANALRRIILNDIPVNAFITETFETNQCTITANTSRFHNEIVKQRLSCIPIIMSDLDILPGNYTLEVDKTNEDQRPTYVTTEDFKIRNKETGEYMEKEKVKRIFPPNRITQDYIIFIRLRPNVNNQLTGEQLKLECEFGVATAKDNSMYNVVSRCSYGNTIDADKAASVWAQKEAEYRSVGGYTEEDIEFEKNNFNLLDVQRCFVENSYDFQVKGLGMYTNKEIVIKGCQVMIDQIEAFISLIDADQVSITATDVVSDNMYDVRLENHDYTLGHMLERALYDKYYKGDNTMNFCGFIKQHPHESDSIVRLGYKTVIEPVNIRQQLNIVSRELIETFRGIMKTFA